MAGPDAGGGQHTPPANGGNGNGVEQKVEASIRRYVRHIGYVVVSAITLSGSVIGIVEYAESRRDAHLRQVIREETQGLKVQMAVLQQEVDDTRRYGGMPPFDRDAAMKRLTDLLAGNGQPGAAAAVTQ